MSTVFRVGGRVLLRGSLLLALAAVAGATWQAYATYHDAHEYRPPGRLVDVNGHRVHLFCAGSGGPTVVFESGLGDDAAVWGSVQPQVARSTRTCVYDRAGLGFSEPGPRPRDSAHISEELHTLLESGFEKGPFLLVAHSIGGLHARLFADRYRNEVVGMVLVEPTSETLLLHPPAAAAPMVHAANQMLSLFAPIRTGMTWLGVTRAASRSVERRPGPTVLHSLTARLETLAIEDDARQVSNTRPSRDIPVIVLSSTKQHTATDGPPLASLFLPAGYNATEGTRALDIAKAAAHQELAHSFRRGKLITTGGSDHYIQVEQPDIVVAAIHDVVASLR